MRSLVLVADAGRARLFASTQRNTPWILLRELEHRAVTSERGNRDADRPGRTQERIGSGRRASLEAPTPAKQIEAEKFALELASEIGRALGADGFDRVIVAAPPRFLGNLRPALAPVLAPSLELVEVAKDLSAMPEGDLPARIATELRGRALPVA